MRGFHAEEHYAHTRDGYYIHLVRIVHPGIPSQERYKRPVIFNHGLLESSTIWLANALGVRPLPDLHRCYQKLPPYSNKSIYLNGPMMLANFGYDVWLMSMRGTDWSLYHDKMKPTNPKFWDYSLDDFALHDIPAVIDHVRSITGATKVGYIGHSQATFSIFTLLSDQPHYAEIVEPVIAVAPVSYFDHIKSVSRLLFLTVMKEAKTLDGRFPKNADKIRQHVGEQCTSKQSLPVMVCQLTDVLIGGRGQTFPTGFYSHLPFYTSYKVLRHFGQLIKGKRFARYDYGAEKNLQVYGSRTNPSYAINRIKSQSIVLISAKTDTLSPPEDVNKFRSELTVRPYRDIFIDKDFGHFDLILHSESAERVFGPILKIFEEFEKSTGACGHFNDVVDFGHDQDHDHSLLHDHGHHSVHAHINAPRNMINLNDAKIHLHDYE